MTIEDQVREDAGNILVRPKRDKLIAETDWWATSDRTMTAEQAAYRQALRDITDQAGFPHDITWPTKPE
jgi:hypothetical protein